MDRTLETSVLAWESFQGKSNICLHMILQVNLSLISELGQAKMECLSLERHSKLSLYWFGSKFEGDILKITTSVQESIQLFTVRNLKYSLGFDVLTLFL